MLATACGYTPAEIDLMDMGDFNMLTEYWQDHPPLHIMAANYLGIKPRPKRNSQSGKEVADILQALPGWSRRMH